MIVKPISVVKAKAELVVLTDSLSVLPSFGVPVKRLQKPYSTYCSMGCVWPFQQLAHNAMPLEIADVRVHIVMRISPSTVILGNIYLAYLPCILSFSPGTGRNIVLSTHPVRKLRCGHS